MRRMVKDAASRLLLTAIIRVVGRTTRKTWVDWHHVEALDTAQIPYICCLWHNNLLYFAWVLRNRRVGAMVSQSRDGEGIARILQAMGFEPVRGSTSRGGVSALRGFLRLLQRHRPVAITPDGPRGPRYVVKPGVIALARKQQVPIVPMCIAAPGCYEFRSWDRMKLPRPFGRVVIMAAPPRWVAADADAEGARRELEAAMRALLRRADAFAGGDLVAREPDLAAPVTDEAPEDPVGAV